MYYFLPPERIESKLVVREVILDQSFISLLIKVPNYTFFNSFNFNWTAQSDAKNWLPVVELNQVEIKKKKKTITR